MSEDGFSDPYDEPTMEIFVETLTGTSFEMRVGPTDTVFSIKNKIQRVEGIPVSHQNLLYKMKELEDCKKLCDVGVTNGSVLKLVLTMRGGPISTRRLSVCDHHFAWKDLKELIEGNRDEIGEKAPSSSRISLLVFKEGDVINLLRVVESEDGSLVPYSEEPISPPSKVKSKADTQTMVFEKLVEDHEMLTKVSQLRQKMEDLSLKRQLRNSKPVDFIHGKSKSCVGEKEATSASASFRKKTAHYKLLTEKDCAAGTAAAAAAEVEEIALKEKHRSKFLLVSPQKTTGTLAATAVKSDEPPEEKLPKLSKYFHGEPKTSPSPSSVSSSSSSPLTEPIALLEENETDEVFGTSDNLSMAARNRVRLTRLVLSETTDRPKSSPDSIELEENVQDVWEIREPPPPPEQSNNGTTCKVGLLKRRQSLDCGNNGLEEEGGLNLNNHHHHHHHHRQAGDFNYHHHHHHAHHHHHHRKADGASEFEIFGNNIYHVPHFVPSASAIPPQYAPKDDRMCEFFSGDSKRRRSPLYGRKARVGAGDSGKVYHQNLDGFGSGGAADSKSLGGGGGAFEENFDFPASRFGGASVSSIERVHNTFGGGGSGRGGGEEFHHHHQEVGEGAAAAFVQPQDHQQLNPIKLRIVEDSQELANEIKRLGGCYVKQRDDVASALIAHAQQDALVQQQQQLPAVNKKRMRCEQCNKKLNITTMYNCRCGRLFCAQHRYSEVHDCKYDYKSEGRKLLERQNPLVVADKLPKF